MTLLRGQNSAPKDVGIYSGHLLEIGDVETEILSDDLKWGVNKLVGKHECGPVLHIEKDLAYSRVSSEPKPALS